MAQGEHREWRALNTVWKIETPWIASCFAGFALTHTALWTEGDALQSTRWPAATICKHPTECLVRAPLSSAIWRNFERVRITNFRTMNAIERHCDAAWLFRFKSLISIIPSFQNLNLICCYSLAHHQPAHLARAFQRIISSRLSLTICNHLQPFSSIRKHLHWRFSNQFPAFASIEPTCSNLFDFVLEL